MVKTLIKIALALVVIHGAFRIGNAYWTFYRFEDTLQEQAQFGDRKTEAQLCDAAMDTAANLGVPITAAQLTVRKGAAMPYNCQDGPRGIEAGSLPQPSSQLWITGTYVDQVQVFPGYFYPWEFSPSVKVWVRV
jgi:hypothetical protein